MSAVSELYVSLNRLGEGQMSSAEADQEIDHILKLNELIHATVLEPEEQKKLCKVMYNFQPCRQLRLTAEQCRKLEPIFKQHCSKM